VNADAHIFLAVLDNLEDRADIMAVSY
jgi:hypothetical protein